MDFVVPRIDRGVVVIQSPPPAVSLKRVSKWDLPRHSVTPSANFIHEKFLWDMELFLGRTAMVSAIFLLFGEVLFGESMASQLASLFAGSIDVVFAILP